MKKLFSLILLLFAMSYTMLANVNDFIKIGNVKLLELDNKVLGYVGLIGSGNPAVFKIAMFNEKMEVSSVCPIEFKDKGFTELKSVNVNSTTIMVHIQGKGLDKLLTFDMSFKNKSVLDLTVEKAKALGGIISFNYSRIRDVLSIENGFLACSIEPTPDNGAAYSVIYYNNDLKEVWTYLGTQEKPLQHAQLSSYSNNILLLSDIVTDKIKSKEVKINVIALNTTTGKELFKFEWKDSEHLLEIPKLCYDKTTDEIFAYCQYYKLAKDVGNMEPQGVCLSRISKQGVVKIKKKYDYTLNILSTNSQWNKKPYSTIETPYFIVLKNGEIFVNGIIIGSKATIVSMKFDSDCSLNKVFTDIREYYPLYRELSYGKSSLVFSALLSNNKPADYSDNQFCKINSDGLGFTFAATTTKLSDDKIINDTEYDKINDFELSCLNYKAQQGFNLYSLYFNRKTLVHHNVYFVGVKEGTILLSERSNTIGNISSSNFSIRKTSK